MNIEKGKLYNMFLKKQKSKLNEREENKKVMMNYFIQNRLDTFYNNVYEEINKGHRSLFDVNYIKNELQILGFDIDFDNGYYSFKFTKLNLDKLEKLVSKNSYKVGE